jgi:hypothetical protein
MAAPREGVLEETSLSFPICDNLSPTASMLTHGHWASGHAKPLQINGISVKSVHRDRRIVTVTN